jgi:hypothetical protein
LVLLGLKLRVLGLEGVGDVLEEDQAEDNVFVLGGVHAAAQGIGHPPQLGLIADVGGCRVIPFRCFGHGGGLFSPERTTLTSDRSNSTARHGEEHRPSFPKLH